MTRNDKRKETIGRCNGESELDSVIVVLNLGIFSVDNIVVVNVAWAADSLTIGTL